MRLSAKKLFGWHNQPQEVSGALSDRFTFFFFGYLFFPALLHRNCKYWERRNGQNAAATNTSEKTNPSITMIPLACNLKIMKRGFVCLHPARDFLSKLHLSYVISFQLIKFKELSLPKTAMAVRTTMKQLKDLWNLQIPKDITIKNASQK